MEGDINLLNFLRRLIKTFFIGDNETKELQDKLAEMTIRYKKARIKADLFRKKNEQLQKHIETLQQTIFLMEEITKQHANDVISTQVATNFVVEPAKPLPNNVKVQSRNIKAIANKSTIVPRDPYAGINKNDELSKLHSTDFFTY